MKRVISLFITMSLMLSCLAVVSPMAAAASNDYTTWRQSDSAWNQSEAWPASKYPYATLHYMSQAGCLVTSIAMLLRHYNVVTDSDVNSFNPWICNEKLKSAGAFDSAADLIWGNVSNAYSGFRYVGKVGYSASKLYELYNQGYACVVAVNNYGHYVAVKSATSSGSVIMDPGWGYTSLSSFRSVNAIFYFSATASKPAAHTCDKGKYVYFWKLHPHPSCYQCSICGEVWADQSTTNYFESCETCTSQITISGANSPGTLTQGSDFNIKGEISSGGTLTNVTIDVFDYNGTTMIGQSVYPSSKNFDISGVDDGIRFSTLSPGVYTYRITATNASTTKTLVEKVFVVLSTEATVKDGIYSILSNSKDCAVSSVSSDSSTNIELAKVDSTSEKQQFKISYVGDGYYSIQNVYSGKFLDVYDASSDSGTNIHQYTGNGSTAQKWQIIPVGSTYCLVAQCATANAMDVKSGDTGTEGTNIWNYTADCSAAQRFYLQEVAQNTYTITYQGGSSLPSTQVKQEGTALTLSTQKPETTFTASFIFNDGERGSTQKVAAVFQSWNTKKDGTGKTYAPGDTYTADESVTLYAQWKAEVTLLDTPEREGYTFDGWYLEPEYGKGTRLSSPVTLTASTEIYAHWTEKTAAEVHFPQVSSYTQGQFTDVAASQWFTQNVASAVEFGLMKGSSTTSFKPYGDVTLAEAITMAARIHSIYTTGSESFVQGDGKWYQVYLNYALDNGIITKAYYNSDVTHKATRAQFAEIFANALPDEALYAMNTIGDDAIPDVSSSEKYASYVYKLYRAGILAGGDTNGTFSPGTYITRAEAAAIVSRMADTDNRVAFTLK